MDDELAARPRPIEVGLDVLDELRESAFVIESSGGFHFLRFTVRLPRQKNLTKTAGNLSATFSKLTCMQSQNLGAGCY